MAEGAARLTGPAPDRDPQAPDRAPQALDPEPPGVAGGAGRLTQPGTGGEVSLASDIE